MIKLRMLIFSVLAMSFFVNGCTAENSELVAEDAWARPANAGGNGAIYLTIENGTNQEKVLIGVTVNVKAIAFEIHKSSLGENDVMSMQPQNQIKIPPNSEISFEPGALHVMIVGLEDDIVIGELLEITLVFQGEEEITIPVIVEKR